MFWYLLHQMNWMYIRFWSSKTFGSARALAIWNMSALFLRMDNTRMQTHIHTRTHIIINSCTHIHVDKGKTTKSDDSLLKLWDIQWVCCLLCACAEDDVQKDILSRPIIFPYSSNRASACYFSLCFVFFSFPLVSLLSLFLWEYIYLLLDCPLFILIYLYNLSFRWRNFSLKRYVFSHTFSYTCGIPCCLSLYS